MSPQLDLRLETVARQIQADCHADIGSDHGKLLVALLTNGRIQSAIAVENKLQPFENSKKAMIGLDGEARFADGLKGLEVGEADSLSICGMGGGSIVAILRADPDRIPSKVVLQPNRGQARVRRWAMENGFHLVEEQITWGRWPYSILTYRSALGIDPAYREEDLDAALMFGPLNIQRSDPLFIEHLSKERRYLQTLHRLSDATRHRLQLIEYVLCKRSSDASHHQRSNAGS